MTTTKQALEYLRTANYAAAAETLRQEFDKNPKRIELAHFANLITPCGMIAEAIDGLRRYDDSLADCERNKPLDEDISRAVAYADSLEPLNKLIFANV